MAMGTTAAREPAGRPNMVVILADDMGFSDAGCYGGEIGTPNIDRLAREGVRFTQCYSTARCWPSRSCLLTGYYAQQVRMDPPEGRLPAWARVLPHYLKPAGYRCYHSGKWHLMGAPAVVADGGFDRSYVLHDHDRHLGPRQHQLDDRELPPVQPGEKYYTATAIADYAIDFLEEHNRHHADQPFCLYLAFTTPHFPLQAPAADIARYRDRYLEGWDSIRKSRWLRLRQQGIVNSELPALDTETIPDWNLTAAELAQMIGPGEAPNAVPWSDLTDEQRRFQATKMAIHAAMVHRMDIEIGRVMAQLKHMGASNNTMTLFASDNGASAEQIIRGDMHDKSAPPGSARSFLCLGPGWSTASNSPLRLHKSWVHEGGISSPLVINWPAGIAGGGHLRHTPCHFIDILPTLMDLGGASAAGPWNGQDPPPMPGKSLAPCFARDATLERDCLWFHHIDNRALRAGDWKIVSAGKTGPWELYDMRTDRCESHNLADTQPGRVREMAARWQELETRFREQAGPAG